MTGSGHSLTGSHVLPFLSSSGSKFSNVFNQKLGIKSGLIGPFPRLTRTWFLLEVSCSEFSFVLIADFRLDIVVWKYQSTLLHRFGESLDHLRERHYTRHYDRYPLVLPPACTIDDIKKDDRITWQWLHGVSEDEFESDGSVLLEVSPSGEDEENTPPRTPFSESSSEPFDPSSTPESESMVADSVITSIANSGANQGSDDVHMQSASEGRGSPGISGFIVPDDDQNAEDDDEEYGGKGKDKGRDDEDEDEGDDENDSGNGEEPSAGRVSIILSYL